jgi:hypothetical protein
MHLSQDGGQRVAVLRVGRRDLAFDRKAERVDGNMALAALDLLGGVKAARPAGLRRLDRLAVDDDRRRRSLAASASRALITSTLTIWVHNPLLRQA